MWGFRTYLILPIIVSLLYWESFYASSLGQSTKCGWGCSVLTLITINLPLLLDLLKKIWHHLFHLVYAENTNFREHFIIFPNGAAPKLLTDTSICIKNPNRNAWFSQSLHSVAWKHLQLHLKRANSQFSRFDKWDKERDGWPWGRTALRANPSQCINLCIYTCESKYFFLP